MKITREVEYQVAVKATQREGQTRVTVTVGAPYGSASEDGSRRVAQVSSEDIPQEIRERIAAALDEAAQAVTPHLLDEADAAASQAYQHAVARGEEA